MSDREKQGVLHPRNRDNGRYDFAKLVEIHPELQRYVIENKFGDQSVNFFDPNSVKSLNRALLALHYGIEYWDIPPTALTPPIPGRADYIHYIADLIGTTSDRRCLDVGVGANCIYPIIGHGEYGWSFVGSDIDLPSIECARMIVERNQSLHGAIELRHQPDRESIFNGIINPNEYFDVTICNPPFHDSAESAERGSLRKLRNLKGKRVSKSVLNFGGRANELWCEGGELQFITNMIRESVIFKDSCGWFTTLVSNEDNLTPLRRETKRVGVKQERVIEMKQGSKRSRILAWRF